MATSAVCPNPSRLFFVCDRSTGLRFLVDTGAEVSVVPPSRTDRNNRQENFSLQAVTIRTLRLTVFVLFHLTLAFAALQMGVYHC